MARLASGTRSAARLAPLLLLLGYGVVFAAAGIGVSLTAFDDHPGQLYRLHHVVTLGPAPWAWNFGWWMGYPELQFYPPAFAYAGALLHVASFGALPVAAAYQALVWLAYLAPGAAVWILLRRLLADGWLALPGAFVALTLSLWPALMSGVEGGVHVGMVPARLGWALLPLLAAALMGWSERASASPTRAVVPLLAAVVLTHPAHVPAAVALVTLAALVTYPRRSRLGTAVGCLAGAAVLTAFWTLPLLARLDHTRALAWGALTPADVADTLLTHPLVVVLLILACVALVIARTAAERVVAFFPWAMAAIVALDALAERLGVSWLPTDRVMDAFWLALVLAGGLGVGRLLERLVAWRNTPVFVGALGAVLAAVALSLAGDDTLTLWPRPATWPSYAATERGLRLPALWAALRGAPEGRVLFVRSGAPLVYGREWWRPHTHVTALTPLMAGRDIVNGTFTHPSPVAAFVYRGSAGGGPITTLVERLDGHALFGRPLEALDAPTFNRYARRLRVSAVVALDEDVPRLAAFGDNPEFRAQRSEPPFVIWLGRPAALPQPVAPGRWHVRLEPAADEWAPVGVAYYPLWRATAGGTPLDTRAGTLGDLEVRVPAGAGAIELSYGPGLPELAGLGLSVLGALIWVALGRHPRPLREAGSLTNS